MKIKCVVKYLLVWSLVSCSKEKAPDVRLFASWLDEAQNHDTNMECETMLSDMETSRHELSLLYTANMGKKVDVMLNGSLPGNAYCEIDGERYLSNLSEGSYLVVQDSMQQHFGKEITFQGSSGGHCTFLSPEPITASPLSGDSSMVISRSDSNILRWEPGGVNPIELVAISYSLYKGEKAASQGGKYKSGFILTEDDGEYDLNNLLDEKTNSVFFILERINGRNVRTSEGPVFFNVRCEDHHFYGVE